MSKKDPSYFFVPHVILVAQPSLHSGVRQRMMQHATALSSPLKYLRRGPPSCLAWLDLVETLRGAGLSLVGGSGEGKRA